MWEKHVKPLWVESGEVPPGLICVRVFRRAKTVGDSRGERLRVELVRGMGQSR